MNSLNPRQDFKTNPNFKYKEEIIEMENWFGINDVFDIYYSQKDNNEPYLISPYKNFSLAITRIKDKKIIHCLKGHNSKIKMIRLFINPIDKKNYLVSSDLSKIVKIWDLTDNNFNLKCSIETKYSVNTCIFSCVLYFSMQNNYLITSSNEDSMEDYIKFFNFEDGSFISNLKETNNIEVFYLLLWKNNGNDRLISCCRGIVLIHDLTTKALIAGLKKRTNESQNHSACITRENECDFLCVTSLKGYVNVWNLSNFKLEKEIYVEKCYFYDIISWNERYIIVAEKTDASIIIIDVYIGKIITKIENAHSFNVISIKKIKDAIYGECLLSCGLNDKIKLWINKLCIN